MADGTPPFEKSRSTPIWKFILRGCALGILCSFIGSIVFGILYEFVPIVINLAIGTPHLPIDNSILLAWIEDIGVLITYSFLFSVLFEILVGVIVSLIVFLMANKNTVEEKQSIKIGRRIGIIFGLILAAPGVIYSFEPLSPTGVDIIGQTNQTIMVSDLTTLFWASIILAITTISGGFIGKKLVKHLPSNNQSELVRNDIH